MILNFCLIAWGFSEPIHVGCGECLLHSLKMLPHQSTVHSVKGRFIGSCIEATDRTGGKGYCSLSAALAKALHEQDTIVLRAVYSKCTLRRSISRVIQVLVDRLSCTTFNISSPFWTLHLPWQGCTGSMNTSYSLKLWCSNMNVCLLGCLQYCWYRYSLQQL
jgi:hypothetical protein